jgi:hypothetical protein
MKRYRWLGSALLVTATALGAVRPSYAADPPQLQLSAEDDAKATKLLAEGNKAFKTGKFVQAERAYREAFTLKRVHDTAANLAMAEFALGKMRDSAEHLAFALRHFPLTGEPALKDAMQKTFDQARQSVGTVKVTVNVKGALVYIDGKLAGEAPLADDIFVSPGEHTLEVSADGYKPMSKKLKADQGSTLQVTLTLASLPRKVREVFVEVPAKRRSIVPALVLAGGSLALGGASLVLYALAEAKQRDTLNFANNLAQASCVGPNPRKYCETIESRARAVDTFHNAAVVSAVVAAVAVTSAVVYLAWPNPQPTLKKSTQVRVHAAPLLGTTEGGVIVFGAF